MSEHFCMTCGEFLYSSGRHACPPVYEARFDRPEKDDRDWQNVRARGAEAAAEKFAEEYDIYNEYNILRQGDRCEEIAEVRDGEGAITRWRITAESLPHYYANEVEGTA
jgi:hypothetical protein